MNKLKVDICFILFFQLIARIASTIIIHKIPCMNPVYLALAERLTTSSKTVIDYSPFFSFLLYLFNKAAGNLLLASEIIFILFSTLLAYFIYKVTELLFDEKTAKISAVFSIFLPAFTVSLAGYSHTVVVACCFELMSIYFLLKYLENNAHNTLRLSLSILFAIACIFIRPENLFAIIIINLLILLFRLSSRPLENKKTPKIFIIQLIFILIGILLHGWFIQEKSSADYKGIFMDSKYSYMTFLNTYSLRFDGIVSDSKSIIRSTPYIGTPEENHYSIAKIILKNPKETFINTVFNLKQLFNNLSHPLFIPIYFYCFLGLAFLSAQKYRNSLIILGGAAVAHIIPLLIFHVEIRYMQPIAIFILILVSNGFTYFPIRQKTALAVTTFLTFTLYLSYLFLFATEANICGVS